jgi:hypothetical protein
MLRNRIYVGELRFGRAKNKGGQGEMVNLRSHKPIVSRELFDRVTAMRGEKGARGETESIHTHLLSRMKVLRCEACGRAMIIGVRYSHKPVRTYVIYRCPPIGDCTNRSSIMADNVDAYVGEWMKKVERSKSFSAGQVMADAQAELEAAQADFKQAMRNLALSKDTLLAQEILEEFRAKTEDKQARVDDLRRALGPSAVVSMAGWDTLTLAGRRDLVRALIKRIDVRRLPGNRHPVKDRVTIHAFGELPLEQ